MARRLVRLGFLAALLSAGPAVSQDGGGDAPAPSYVEELTARAADLIRVDRPDRDPAFAARLLRQAAETGEVRAMILLARLYARGDGVAADPAAARDLLLRASLSGDPAETGLALGEFYASPGPLRDPARAVIALRAAAKAGSAIAKVRLAALLLAGEGAPRDLAVARALLDAAIAEGEVAAGSEILGDWHLAAGPQRNPPAAMRAYEVAARAGNPGAMVKLARLVGFGGGVARNLAYAEALAEAAVAAGREADGYTILGEVYLSPGPLRDVPRAAALLEKGVALGDTTAMLRLAQVLIGGGPVRADLPRAKSLLETAIAAGRITGPAVVLGDLLQRSGPLQDLPAAAAAYKLAAGTGNAAAMVSLARLTAAGQGVAADRDEAIRLLEEAIALGAAGPASEFLGDLYLAEPGGGARAAAAYQVAATAGNANAQFKLATIFRDGRDVGVDLDRARTLLDGVAGRRQAPASLRASAFEALAGLYLDRQASFANAGNAAEALDRAARLGSTAAMIKLGTMLAEGTAIPRDPDRAIAIFQRAVEAGAVKEASEKLGLVYLSYPAPAGDPTAARQAFEAAAAAGSATAHMRAAALASPDYEDAGARRALVAHYRAAAALGDPRPVVLEMMQLPPDALITVTQQLLVDAGIRAQVNGRHGRNMRTAIESFCARASLPRCETDFVTLELLEGLLAAAPRD